MCLLTISNAMSLLHWAIHDSVFRSNGAGRVGVRVIKGKSEQDGYKRKLFQLIKGLNPSLGANRVDFMGSADHNPHADQLSLKILNNAAQLASADDRWRKTELKKILL